MRKQKIEDVPILPEAGDTLPLVEMRTRHASNHPWIYRRMLAHEYTELEPGTLVEVVENTGRFVGRGFYNANSEIAVRLLALTREGFPDRRFFLGVIARAVKLRHEVLNLPQVCDSYRLIHSEGDELSGLIADKYGPCIVLELFSAGIHRHLEWIKQGFAEHFPDHELIIRSDHRTERLEGVKMDGAPPRTRELVIREHNLKLHVDLRRGHKTGFFLDQRDNRKRVGELCAGQEVFDGCCYTGGFALSAALNGAHSVEACDLDEKAIAIAEKNKTLNEVGPQLTFIHGNIFDVLRERRSSGRRFDRIILDPAKMAGSRQEVPKALSAYADMNRLAMQCLKPGGVLVTCSCTGLVSEEDFLMTLNAAAIEANVELQVLAIHGASPDHPWAVRVPEGRYLKVVYCRVSPLR